jgi:hypothetical protein
MVETAKRVFVKPETLDFGVIGAGATAELVVETGLPQIVVAGVNPPDGFEADLMVSAYAVPSRNEVQDLDNDATGGTFTLTYDGEETGDIPYDASAAVLETALEALSNVVDVDVTLNGASDWSIEFLNPGPQDNPILVADDTNLTGEIVGSSVSEATKGRAPGTVLVRCANVSAGGINPAEQDFQIVCQY